MLSVINWQLSDFAQPANYNRLKAEVDELWRYDEISPAWRLYKELVKQEEVWAKLDDQELRSSYNQLKRRLAYLSLPFLEDKEVEGIFKTDLAEALSYVSDDYNLLNKIRSKLMLVPLVERDAYKAKLLKALEENEEKLTEMSIDKDGEQIEGTIKNWLADFRYYLAEHKTDEKLAQIEYLYKAENVLKLNSVEREKVRRLITLYNCLRKSSLTLDGMEDVGLVEKDGETFLLDDGKLIKLSDQAAAGFKFAQVKPLEQSEDKATGSISLDKKEDKVQSVPLGKNVSLTTLMQIYERFLKSSLMKKIDQLMDELWAKYKDDFKALRGYFYHAVNQRQIEKALAALLIIAKLGKVRQVFGEDERFVKFWSKYLAMKNLDVEHFKNDPAKAEFLAMFFKYILEERLNLPAQQAVLVGMLISNLCRQAGELEYQFMVYGDVQSGEFKWNI